MTEPGAPAVEWEAPDPDGPAPGIAFAPHGARLVAYLVDALIVTAVSIGLFVAGRSRLHQRRVAP